jgi:hypothetical protein
MSCPSLRIVYYLYTVKELATSLHLGMKRTVSRDFSPQVFSSVHPIWILDPPPKIVKF